MERLIKYKVSASTVVMRESIFGFVFCFSFPLFVDDLVLRFDSEISQPKI